MTKLFETAAEEAKRLKKTPNAGEIADLYGLYKQATVGVVTFARPGFLDFTGRAKWDAWNSKKELTKEEAMAAYVGLVEQLKEKYGLEEELKVKYGLEEELKEKYGVEEELKEKYGVEEEKKN